MVENGTRADIARKRFEDTNQLTAKHMIYVGTGDTEEVTLGKDKSYIYKTEGKNIISAINDATKDEAGIIDKAHSAETADQATNAETAKKIVSEDDSSITIIKGKSNNNQNRIVPPGGVEVDLGASGYEFAKVYANTFTGTANAAIDTNFSREDFTGGNLGLNTYIQLPIPPNDSTKGAGFYYFYLRMPVGDMYHNINFGLVYWEGESKYDSFSAIAGCYKGDKDSELLLDEYCLHITTSGTVVVWKKDNTTNGWKKVENSLARLFYKKIR